MTSEAEREAPPETLRSWVRDELPNVVALHRVEAMGNVHRHILVALVSTVVVVDEAQRACPEKIVRINFHRYPRRSYRASADSSCDCEGCDVVGSDHAPQAGVAQGFGTDISSGAEVDIR